MGTDGDARSLLSGDRQDTAGATAVAVRRLWPRHRRTVRVRFTLKWTEPSGESRTGAGMRVYRADAGKLGETWLQFPTTRLGVD